MGQETFNDGPYRTFEADVPGDLAGKENYLVELTATGTIQLFTSGVAIGVLHQRLEGGADWNVRLLGKGGTVKVIANGAITAAGRVKGESGGKVVALGASGRSIGSLISPDTAAAGDVCEIIDVVENVA